MYYHRAFLLLFVLIPMICNGAINQHEPIKIILNNWTSQIVLSQVTGELLASQGFKVEFVDSSVSDQWGGLAHGILHLQMEVWEGTMSDKFNHMVNTGRVVDAGTHSAKTREEWWYPSYVEKVCPGLPDWKALGRCAALFSRNGSQGKGVYIAGPWEKPDAARIRALNLNFTTLAVKKGDDLWVQLKAAVESQMPIVLFNWTPNWVESRYDGKFIEFPKYAPECETDPAWGVNSKFVYDCGNPKDGWLKKAVWAQFEKKWPCAFTIVKKISLSNNQIAEAAAYVDVDGLSHTEAAKRWMLNNRSIWQSWLAASCTK